MIAVEALLKGALWGGSGAATGWIFCEAINVGIVAVLFSIFLGDVDMRLDKEKVQTQRYKYEGLLSFSLFSV